MPKLAPEFFCKVAKVKKKSKKQRGGEKDNRSQSDDTKLVVHLIIDIRFLLQGINGKCFNNVLKFLSNKQTTYLLRELSQSRTS